LDDELDAAEEDVVEEDEDEEEDAVELTADELPPVTVAALDRKLFTTVKPAYVLALIEPDPLRLTLSKIIVVSVCPAASVAVIFTGKVPCRPTEPV